MSDKVKLVLYKITITILILLIVNAFFIFLYSTVFSSVYFSITLILFNVFVAVDKMLQPSAIYGKKEKTKVLQKAFFLILFLLLNPFLFTLPYLEYSFITRTIFSPETILAFWALGNLILMIGGITMCMSRFILGKEGTVIIGIEKEHKLITKGPYHFVRHPIYSGIVLFFLGYALSFSSIVGAVILLLVIIPWFRKRMTLEEKLLMQTFGDEYREYMSHTKRLIPFIY